MLSPGARSSTAPVPRKVRTRGRRVAHVFFLCFGSLDVLDVDDFHPIFKETYEIQNPIDGSVDVVDVFFAEEVSGIKEEPQGRVMIQISEKSDNLIDGTNHVIHIVFYQEHRTVVVSQLCPLRWCKISGALRRRATPPLGDKERHNRNHQEGWGGPLSGYRRWRGSAKLLSRDDGLARLVERVVNQVLEAQVTE